MWTPKEAELFAQAGRLIASDDYSQGLQAADRLLQLVQHNDQRKIAYVLGCKTAVALRHTGATDQAAATFAKAYKMAWDAREWAIASYILNDWSSMYSGDQAASMVREAIELRKQNDYTPDQQRTLVADIAYFEATLARILYRYEDQSEAKAMIGKARKTLRKQAYGPRPRYKDAYLVVLVWELGMYRPQEFKQYAPLFARIVVETLRQGKLIAAIKLLSPTRRRRIKPDQT
jgi:hypothetical protein